MCPPHPGVPVPSPHAGLLRLSAADSQQPHASTHVDLLPAFRRRLGRQGLNCIHCFYELYPCSFIFLTCYPDVPGVYVHHVVLQYKSKSVGVSCWCPGRKHSDHTPPAGPLRGKDPGHVSGSCLCQGSHVLPE